MQLGQLTGKQFLVTDVEIILRNREGLADHAAYRILCRAAFQSLGVSVEHGRHQFHFAYKHRCLHDLHFTDHRSHQTEIVSAASQLDLYTDLVDHVAILENDVGMQTIHRIERALSNPKARRFTRLSFAALSARFTLSIPCMVLGSSYTFVCEHGASCVSSEIFRNSVMCAVLYTSLYICVLYLYQSMKFWPGVSRLLVSSK